MVFSRYENGTDVIERWDRVFEAVAAEPRRQLIVSLLDREPDQSVRLPESAVNPNVPIAPERLERELKHCHLPLLADGGYIEWESDPFVASRGSRFEEVAVVFETLHSFAADVPDQLVLGCQRLERERQFG
ncbi:hypothetical protein [Natrarchaeobaculum sulfurireducens]|uniref:Transcriptional regulator, ArsR family n=1 Tax=Natrarchaeobaculum sulfurireducens TaxID=2044521 RepID=A0A346PC21_9EURY|nr:hypothetical protein [Natrarchaeobaculum sulfurireducens]AXR77066.1 hypothetical protein AArc1_0723 [Natrarchaeobaculum sulfurireducens]AXR82967.1 hypothetical protein AArcMg_2979 [Natrarchaeobaculum sulfurireducens]